MDHPDATATSATSKRMRKVAIQVEEAGWRYRASWTASGAIWSTESMANTSDWIGDEAAWLAQRFYIQLSPVSHVIRL